METMVKFFRVVGSDCESVALVYDGVHTVFVFDKGVKKGVVAFELRRWLSSFCSEGCSRVVFSYNPHSGLGSLLRDVFYGFEKYFLVRYGYEFFYEVLEDVSMPVVLHISELPYTSKVHNLGIFSKFYVI